MHGIALTVAKIIYSSGFIPQKAFQGQEMGMGQIGNMDVIPHARTIFCLVIVAEYLNMLTLAQGCGKHKRY